MKNLLIKDSPLMTIDDMVQTRINTEDITLTITIDIYLFTIDDLLVINGINGINGGFYIKSTGEK